MLVNNVDFDVEPNLYEYAIQYLDEKYPNEKYKNLENNFDKKYMIYTNLKFNKDIIKLFNDNLIKNIFNLINELNLSKEIINYYINNRKSLIFYNKQTLKLIDDYIQNDIDYFLSNNNFINYDNNNSYIYKELLNYIE